MAEPVLIAEVLPGVLRGITLKYNTATEPQGRNMLQRLRRQIRERGELELKKVDILTTQEVLSILTKPQTRARTNQGKRTDILSTLTECYHSK